MNALLATVGGIALAGAGLSGWWPPKRARLSANPDPDGLYDDLLGLQVLQHDATEEPQLDVCFVHSVTSGPRSTWATDGDVFWPRDLLAQERLHDADFPSVRILIYGYDTDVDTLAWLTERTLFHHAKLLVEHLSTVREGKSVRRPLLFVAHGLGGLLVKNALASARYAGSSPSDIFANTIGIISFGVPKTAKSDLALWETLLSLHRLSNRAGSKRRALRQQKYRDIETEDGRLEVSTLHRRLCKYKRLAVFIPEVYVFEQNILRDDDWEPIATSDRVLPKADSKNINVNSCAIDINRNFFDLPSFSYRDTDYKCICAAIKEFFRKFPRRTNSGLLGREDLHPINRGCIRDLGYSLEPVDLPEEPPVIARETLDKHIKNIEQRLSIDRYVPLTGEPELGKTTAALMYAHEKWRLPDTDSSKPTCILWINAESDVSLNASFKKIARRLGEKYPTSVWPRSNENQEVAVRSVLDWLAYPGNNRWLIIYDDALEENAAYLQPYKPRDFLSAIRGQMIVTVRHSTPISPTSRIGFPKHGPVHEDSNMNENASRLYEEPSPIISAIDSEYDEDSHPSFLPGEKPVFMGPRLREPDYFIAQKPARRYTEPLQIEPLTREESINLFKRNLELSDSQQPGFSMSQLGDFQSRSEKLVEAMNKDLDEVANDIAERVSDKPGKLKDATNILQFATDLGAAGRELCGSFIYEEIPAGHETWLDPCVMLAEEPIPVVVVETLLQNESNQGYAYSDSALECLMDIRKKGWVGISSDSTYFKILLTERRKQRRKFLQGGNDFSNDKVCAQRACNAIIESLKRLQNDLHLPMLEQLLVKHMPECLKHLRHWGSDLTCDWEILADLCNKHNMLSSALEFLEAIESQGFPGPEIPCTSRVASLPDTGSFDMLDDEYFAAKTWNDVLRGESSDPVKKETQVNETQDSRNLRVVLKIIRIKVKLGRFEDKDMGCENHLEKIEDRTEKRYVDLQIGLLKELIEIKRTKKAWKYAIERGYQLLTLLEEMYGYTSAEAAAILHQMAKIHRSQGDYSASIDLLEQALISYEDRPGGYSYFLARDVLYDLAYVHRECGNLKKARDVCVHLRKSLRNQHGAEHTEVARVCELLGHIYESMGHQKDADDSFEAAISAASLFGEGGSWNNEQQRILQVHEKLKFERRRSLGQLYTNPNHWSQLQGYLMGSISTKDHVPE